jgi:hypothetical protein
LLLYILAELFGIDAMISVQLSDPELPGAFFGDFRHEALLQQLAEFAR